MDFATAVTTAMRAKGFALRQMKLGQVDGCQMIFENPNKRRTTIEATSWEMSVNTGEMLQNLVARRVEEAVQNAK